VALAAAIREGRVLGAGLDVTAEEPLPTDSPLLELDRVVLTPHVGGAVANKLPPVSSAGPGENADAVLSGAGSAGGDVVVP